MARFFGTVQGNRGMITRCGHTRMTATADGWNQGGKVYCASTDAEEITNIYATTGSNGGRQILVAYIHGGKLYVRDRRGKDGFIHKPW
jgi:hypothetical protein